LEPEEDADNQSSSNGKAFRKADSVENASDNAVKRCQKDKEAGLNQEREDIDSDVRNQSVSNVQVVKKVVGSGRVEKACDSVIGKRQKHYAQSWSRIGSRSLAILKVVELNHRWLNIWFPPVASNDLQEAANDPCVSGELELVA